MPYVLAKSEDGCLLIYLLIIVFVFFFFVMPKLNNMKQEEETENKIVSDSIEGLGFGLGLGLKSENKVDLLPCKKECCKRGKENVGSNYSCSGGCICMTGNMKKVLESRGNNK